MTLRIALLASLPAGVMFAQLSNFRIQGVTATQAVVAYTAPDTRACRIELSESPRYLPVVPDVDPRIFSLANQDLERNSVVSNSQRDRIVILGRRAAETGIDGKRYSRALQAYTTHYLRVSCGNAVQEASFTTTNIPLGMTYNDPLPADPAKPGEFAWPTVDWADRFQRIVDPKTGLLIRRLSMPDDTVLQYTNQPFPFARDLDGVWSNVSSVAANDSQAASAQETGWLFLDANLSLYLGGTRDYYGYSINALPIQVNAWCDNCGAVSAAGRTIEACLSIDGTSCAGKVVEAILDSCNGDCTNTRYRVTLGAGGPPVGLGWGMDNYDITDYHRRTGQVTRKGNLVSLTSGNKFNVHWKAGSRIQINGTSYIIAKVNHERLLTLEGDVAGEESGAYVGSNFGLMIRRKIAGAGRIMVQYASFNFTMGDAPPWDPSGDQETYTGCSSQQVAGPNGEPGWHCVVGSILLWIGGESGIVNRIGRPTLPPRSGADGWSGPGYCNNTSGGGPIWDSLDPDAFYCGKIDSTRGTILVKAKYFGSNSDIGSLDIDAKLVECNASRNNMPCWEITNITPSSRSQNLNQQIERMHPEEWRTFMRNSVVTIAARKGNKLQLVARTDSAVNDALGFVGVFDIAQGQVTAATPSWRYWPLRWTVLHGVEAMFDDEWMPVPATYFRGPFAAREFLAGFGPYYSRITSGPISNTGSPCPARPIDSPIPPHEWPTGNKCLTFSIDGEPGDPTPQYFNDGTVTSTGNVITGNGTRWAPYQDGMQMRVEGVWYTFEYTSATSGRVTPTPATAFRNAAYELYVEPMNSPVVANPLFAYLQSIEVRDVLVLGNDPYYRNLFFLNEYVKVLLKQGKTLTVQRALGPEGNAMMLPLVGNGWVLPVPGSCLLGPVYPCANTSAVWNTVQDPTGKNPAGTTMVVDRTNEGAGHASAGPTATIAAVADFCPSIDNIGYSCYNVRPGRTFPERAQSVNFRVSNNPPFQGRAGLGIPNIVDSHPNFKQQIGVAADQDLNWFLDARPFMGSSNITGTAENPGVEVEEGLWKFVPAQIARLRPKLLPTFAFCGPHPLRDVSGPLSRISGPTVSADQAYSYCVAMNGGECREESSPGEVFVSCPQVSTPYCLYPGVGAAGSDNRDICIGDNGSHTQGITQLGLTEPEDDGRSSRILTYGFSQYRFNDPFWNPKASPDGKWLFFRSQWVNGKRTDAFLAKLPPFEPVDDQKRNGYLFNELQVGAGEMQGQAGAMIEFGYNAAFECTSRRESCVAGAPGAESEPFYYSTSETWSPVACAEGCTLRFPVIPQRVVYFRVKYFDAEGKSLGQSGTNVWGFQ
jgi:hypothetical protein